MENEIIKIEMGTGRNKRIKMRENKEKLKIKKVKRK